MRNVSIINIYTFKLVYSAINNQQVSLIFFLISIIYKGGTRVTFAKRKIYKNVPDLLLYEYYLLDFLFSDCHF